jgi:hypothetical protein
MEANKKFIGKLMQVQQELKAPKNQYNKFGRYSYRNQEDILEAVKPLLKSNGLAMTIIDSVKEVCGMPFVEATVTITDGASDITATAQAGIDVNRKGMDIAQSFGASSSYARKYALNGLFLIDDTKDADATSTHGSTTKTKSDSPTAKVKMTQEVLSAMMDAIKEGKVDVVKSRMSSYTMTKAQKDKLNKALS